MQNFLTLGARETVVERIANLTAQYEEALEQIKLLSRAQKQLELAMGMANKILGALEVYNSLLPRDDQETMDTAPDEGATE